jgi:hypothetical protein
MNGININQLSIDYNKAKNKLKELCKNDKEFTHIHNYLFEETDKHNTKTIDEHLKEYIKEVNKLITYRIGLV